MEILRMKGLRNHLKIVSLAVVVLFSMIGMVMFLSSTMMMMD